MNNLPDEYVLIGEVAHIGMSKLYKAYRKENREECVIKAIPRDVSEETISLLKKVKHPMLPQLYEIVEQQDALCIIEEYIQGTDLQQILLENGPVQGRVAAEWMSQLCELFIYFSTAFELPIVCGDVKPSNLVQTKDGTLKLVDIDVLFPYRMNRQKLQTVNSMGTPGYASPEQLRGQQIDQRSDIYSIGISMLVMLTGTQPEELTDIESVKEKVKANRDVNMYRTHEGFDQCFIQILFRCIQSNVHKRYQTFQALLAALQLLQEGKYQEALDCDRGLAIVANQTVCEGVTVLSQ